MEELKAHRPKSRIAKALARLNVLRAGCADAADAEKSLREAEALNDIERANALIRLAPLLPERLLADALRLCAGTFEPWRAHTLQALAPRLPEAMRAEALRIATAIHLDYFRAHGIVAVAPYLSESLLTEALSAAEAIDDDRPSACAEALAGLAQYLTGALLARALASASARLRGKYRVQALAAIIPRLPPGRERDAALSDALQTAEAIEDAVDRIGALRALVRHMPTALQERAVVALLQGAGRATRVHLLDAIPELMDTVKGFKEDCSVIEVCRAVHDAGRWFE